MFKTANNCRVNYENRKQIRCTEKTLAYLVSRDRLETPITHKLGSFQAVPKEVIIKNPRTPHQLTTKIHTSKMPRLTKPRNKESFLLIHVPCSSQGQ